MSKPSIFIDLDGPILDVSCKYWRVHRDVLAELGKACLPMDEYRHLKRARTPITDILCRVDAQHLVEQYTQMRIARIETREYLKYDQVWPGARETLIEFRKKHRLVLVTLRRSAQTLQWELDYFKLTPLFDLILSSAEQRTPPWQTKVDMIHSEGYEKGMGGMIVGDTETDILAGKHLGLKTVGVLCGIRLREHLEAAGADLIVPSISDLIIHLAETDNTSDE